MRASHLFVVSLALAVTGLGATAGEASGQASVSTFTKNVAPILFARCITCHRPGEIAPMSLLSYEDARPWAKAIREKVVSREMPPWHADPRYGKFSNDHSLTAEQIATIVAWVDAGAPKGREQDMPPPPVFPAGWNHTIAPDVVIEMPVEYHLPAEGEIPYLNFYARVPFNEDRLASATEYRPGNTRVIHHASASLVTSLPEGSKIVEGRLMFADGTFEVAGIPALRGVDEPPVRRGVPDNRESLASYVPGRGAHHRLPGLARRIPAGNYVVFSQHYQASGKQETDRSKLGIWFSKEVEAQQVYGMSSGYPMRTARDQTYFYLIEGSVETHGPRERGFPPIPAYAENFRVIGVTPVVEPITLYSLLPHMHLRGKDLAWILTWPDGREQVLLSIPKYDFNWQFDYELEEPLKIPAGSTITGVAHYDNSVRNKFNPGPDQTVYWGEQSWDEMFLPGMQYSIDREAPRAKKTSTPQQQQP